MTRLVAVIGSVTPPGRLNRAVTEALARVDGAETETLDLANLRVSFADGRPPADFGDDSAAAVDAIAGADAVLLATPVYRGSLTGALKNLLDLTPIEALRSKPTAIVAMGASPHHFLGADRHLRDILTFFGAFVTPVSTYLTSADFRDGVPNITAADELDLLLTGVLGLVGALNGTPGPAPLAARGR